MQDSNTHYSNSSYVIPSRFRIRKKQRNSRANRALYGESAPAFRLYRRLRRPCFYSLHWHNLGLTAQDADKKLIYNKATIEKWKAAIAVFIKSPYFFCIEVGREGEIHAHVVADIDAGLLKYQRRYDTRTVKIIKDTALDRFRVVRYMYKSPVPIWTDDDDAKAELLPDWEERLETYYRALKRGKGLIPLLSGYVFG